MVFFKIGRGIHKKIVLVLLSLVWILGISKSEVLATYTKHESTVKYFIQENNEDDVLML